MRCARSISWVAIATMAVGCSSNGGTAGADGSAAGASGTPSGGGSSLICQPGITQACYGPGLCVGAQACNGFGTGWGVCDCGTGTGGAAGANAAGGANTGGSTNAGGSSSNGGATAASNTQTLGGSYGVGGMLSPTGGSMGVGGAIQTSGGTTVSAAGGIATAGSNSATGGTSSIGGRTAVAGGTAVSSCGDGKLQIGEQCDDATNLYPGCSDTCQLETGYTCPLVGAPCVPACGDGIVVQPTEQCDPGSKVASMAQACNADCSVKTGWACDSTSCRHIVCGDGRVEGTEGCDPSIPNNDLGDGCSPTCMTEPSCPAAGGSCTTKCGDGLVLGNEECDDGNAVSGDGCSSDCRVEDGFSCSQHALADTMVVPMVVRDFNAGADFEKGSSFAIGLYWANQGLLNPSLDSSGLKPELNSTTGTLNGKTGQDSGIASAASFAQWYSDTATGPNHYNATAITSLNLYLVANSDPPTYTNRFGTNGDGLNSAQYQRTSGLTDHLCGVVGQEDHNPTTGAPIPCTACYSDECPETPQCDTLVGGVCTHQTTPTDCTTNPNYLRCYSDGKYYYGVYVQTEFDGNPLLFPADVFPKPWSPEAQGQIAGNFDASWPLDPTKKTHNFSFTTETRFWFKYDSAKAAKITVVSTDDAWVFVNKKLAMDLGGIHVPVQGVLSFSNGDASVVVSSTWPTDDIVTIPASTVNLGLEDGNVYEVAVFQAQRQTSGSSYQLSLSGMNNAPRSICKPVCGGTRPAVSPGEACDNGDSGNCNLALADCYNKCTTTCTLGPRCGDGIIQTEHEQCDNGWNTDGYAATSAYACSPDCTLPPICGDGIVQSNFGEECDNGAQNNGEASGDCSARCTRNR